MPERALRPLTVGIVDDTDTSLDLMAAILRALDVGPIAAFRDRDRLLEDAQARRLDLVLAGSGTPHPGGLDLVRQIRTDGTAGLADLPIILLSTSGARSAMEDAVRAGADDFLARPVRPSLLLTQMLQRVLTPLPRLYGPGYFGPDRRRGLVRPIAFSPDQRRGD